MCCHKPHLHHLILCLLLILTKSTITAINNDGMQTRSKCRMRNKKKCNYHLPYLLPYHHLQHHLFLPHRAIPLPTASHLQQFLQQPLTPSPTTIVKTQFQLLLPLLLPFHLPKQTLLALCLSPTPPAPLAPSVLSFTRAFPAPPPPPSPPRTRSRRAR